MSLIGTLLALVGLAAVKRPSEAAQEREEMLERLACVEAELATVRAEGDAAREELARRRAEVEILLAGASRCQYQAQLNRAMQEDQWRQLDAQRNTHCSLAHDDCNMRHAGQELGYLRS